MFQNRQRLTDRQTETERQSETNGQTELTDRQTHKQTQRKCRQNLQSQFFPVKPSLQIQRYPSKGTST